VSDQFYLQDSRSFVGNDVLWWARNSCGYTTDLSKAHVFTLEEAQAHHNGRHTDIPWPKDYIDARTRPAVDMQYIRRAEALPGSGIVLRDPPKRIAEKIKCHACGAFMSRRQMYGPGCPKCGADNCP
jgi:hypothetical protein